MFLQFSSYGFVNRQEHTLYPKLMPFVTPYSRMLYFNGNKKSGQKFGYNKPKTAKNSPIQTSKPPRFKEGQL
jgi:hypothetical protein